MVDTLGKLSPHLLSLSLSKKDVKAPAQLELAIYFFCFDDVLERVEMLLKESPKLLTCGKSIALDGFQDTLCANFRVTLDDMMSGSTDTTLDEHNLHHFSQSPLNTLPAPLPKLCSASHLALHTAARGGTQWKHQRNLHQL